MPEAIRLAAKSGFDAVECHWPYDAEVSLINQALDETGLTMLGLNTPRGELGQMGLSALPDREIEAQAAIDQAIEYAAAIGALNIHAMAGIAKGPEAQSGFIKNLSYACDKASKHNITILIEPINQGDAPGYFLSDFDHAASIIQAVNKSNIKMMFDCYHGKIIHGEVETYLRKYIELIGHIQIASVPGRNEPDEGNLNYAQVYKTLDELGYDKPLGAEYHPKSTVENNIGWLAKARG